MMQLLLSLLRAARDSSVSDDWILRTAVGRMEEDDGAFSSGADDGRPPDVWQLTSASRSTIFCPDGRCFVKRSAGLHSPLTSQSSMGESLTRCCTQSARVSMCLSLQRPARPHIPIVAVESVHTLRSTSQPRSSRSAWYPRPIPEAFTTPYNSASPELRLITA